MIKKISSKEEAQDSGFSVVFAEIARLKDISEKRPLLKEETKQLKDLMAILTVDRRTDYLEKKNKKGGKPELSSEEKEARRRELMEQIHKMQAGEKKQ